MNAPISPLSRYEQAQALHHALEECLEANAYGGDNPSALSQIHMLTGELRSVSGLFAEKADSLGVWAAVLYSSRKHTRWGSSYQSGAETIAHFMRGDLASMRVILSRLRDCT